MPEVGVGQIVDALGNGGLAEPVRLANIFAALPVIDGKRAVL